MARTSVWLSWKSALAALVTLGSIACQERLTAPGRCPELCPPNDLEIEDTTLVGVVVSDSSFRGYVLPHESPVMVVSAMDSLTSVAVIRFDARPSRWFPTAGDTAGVRIGAVDSVTLDVRLLQRDTAAKNLELLVYRIPVDQDSATTWDSLSTLIDDSRIIQVIPVHDTITVANIVYKIPPAAIEPDTITDSGMVAIAIGVRADRRTAVTLFSGESGASPRLRFYVRGEAPNDTLRNTFNLGPRFDTFVGTPTPRDAGFGIVVGNLPAARALLRFELPEYIVDSTSVLRASLQLRLQQPVSGRPNETFSIRAVPVLRDFGGKSVLIPDTSVQGRGTVTVGDTGTVVIEMSRVLRFWRAVSGDSIPRAVVLRADPEDATLGELRAARGGAGAAAPTMRITFIRPYRFGVP